MNWIIKKYYSQNLISRYLYRRTKECEISNSFFASARVLSLLRTSQWRAQTHLFSRSQTLIFSSLDSYQTRAFDSSRLFLRTMSIFRLNRHFCAMKSWNNLSALRWSTRRHRSSSFALLQLRFTNESTLMILFSLD